MTKISLVTLKSSVTVGPMNSNKPLLFFHVVMKRTRSTALGPYKNKQFKKPRRVGPVRAYTGSKVPLASRGYKYNTMERKLSDILPTVVPANSTAAITALCVPTLGTDFTNRVGRKIRISSVQGRALVRTTLGETLAVGNSGAQKVRLMILIDLQPNGALPAITDILTNSHPSANMNLNNRDRFKILLDKTWNLDPYLNDATAGTSRITATNQCRNFKFYKKCDQETIFNATNGGTIADITSGALIRVVLGNQPVPVVGPPAIGAGEMVISSRVRFMDA